MPGTICDFAVADLDGVGNTDPLVWIKEKLGGRNASLLHSVREIIPAAATSRKPALIIVDSTEELQGSHADARNLSFALSKESVDCGGMFHVLALCSNLVVAESMLSANGGKKVRPLDTGDVLEEACRLQGDQCGEILKGGMELYGIQLNDADLAKASACAKKGGGVGPIRNFVNDQRDGVPLARCLANLRSNSDKLDAEWKKNRSFGKTCHALS